MKSGFRSGREKKLLAFFTEHFERLSPTAEVKILGGIGYVTQDPENIEAILSNQFQGKPYLIEGQWQMHPPNLSDYQP